MFSAPVVGVRAICSPSGTDVCLPAQVQQNNSYREAQKKKCVVKKRGGGVGTGKERQK